jgi:hypothetical protein
MDLECGLRAFALLARLEDRVMELLELSEHPPLVEP